MYTWLWGDAHPTPPLGGQEGSLWGDLCVEGGLASHYIIIWGWSHDGWSGVLGFYAEKLYLFTNARRHAVKPLCTSARRCLDGLRPIHTGDKLIRPRIEQTNWCPHCRWIGGWIVIRGWIQCLLPHREQCIGSIRPRIHEFVPSIRLVIRLRCG